MLGSLNGLLIAVGFLVGNTARAGSMRKAVRLWAFGATIQPLGWIVSVYRHVLPELPVVLISNGCMALAVAAFGEALRELVSKPRSRWVHYGIPLLAVATLAPLTWPVSYFHARVVWVSLLGGIQLGDVAYALFRHSRVHGAWRASHLLVAGCFGLGSVLMTARFVVEATRIESIPALYVITPMEAAAFLYIATISTLTSVGFLSMCNDRYHDELLALASTDPLTGLANRRGLGEHAERMLAHCRRTGHSLALVVIDIDHFKSVNDRYGHDVGDEVLVSVARRLRTAVRGHDVLARLGGEEFVVMLAEATEADALVAAERLRKSVLGPSVAALRNVEVTVSVGVAASTGVSAQLEELMRRADSALYVAKTKGRNRVERASAPAMPAAV